MRQKRLRSKMFRAWLNDTEHEFLNSYAEKNFLTASELFRGWLHKVMIKEGYDIQEPQNPESINKGGRK